MLKKLWVMGRGPPPRPALFDCLSQAAPPGFEAARDRNAI
jgi:hypothetical protein